MARPPVGGHSVKPTWATADTVAFHLCHVFWKLGVTSRVQLARMAAEQAATG